MRPLLKPALRRLWRDGTTLQLGVEAGRALILRGIGPAEAAFILSLDGTTERGTAIEAAAAHGLDPARAAGLLDTLTALDAIDDASLEPARGLPAADRDRLAPDLAALSLRRPGPGGARSSLQRRRDACVAVEGAGRVGSAIVGLLGAAGVGRVVPVDPRPLRSCDLGPAGPGCAELGLTRDEAAVVAARRAVPGLRRDAAGPPLLTVLAPDAVVDPVRRNRLASAGHVHLPVTVLEDAATVGPLVHPGATPCLGCVDLHHTDRDPAWPVLLAQLTAEPPAVAACDVVLATLAAAIAARLVLAFLDEPQRAIGAGVTYALASRDAVPRRRTYGFHPSCGCRWDQRP